jgi:hypothetical protein
VTDNGLARTGVSALQLALLRYGPSLNINDLATCCARAAVVGHLIVVNEPYLSAMIAGRKTIESRWSKKRTPPFGRVNRGDVLILKEVSGPIRAIAAIARVEAFGPLPPGGACRIMDQHREELALEDAFRERKQDDPFGTLMFLGEVRSVQPLALVKRDRRSWVMLGHHQLRLA